MEDWPWPDEWTEEYYEDWEDYEEPQYISALKAGGNSKKR